ncbi:hypothetical protein [Streptomyces sp. LaPpAH-108]|uniref:hypothetical protein n=1 Tax=Streptomyces sp. LaPpAH-108 TaxID=1155714 RepID=UPI0003800120|nr:hypothetical protein [Streptomyces sp. LaPpAH-108]
MPHREFQPGRLITGLAFAATAALYLGNAQHLWHIPWFTALPITAGALFLAGVTGAATRAIRGRRRVPEDG